MLFGVHQLLSQLPHVTFTLMEKELKPSATTATDLGITWDTADL